MGFLWIFVFELLLHTPHLWLLSEWVCIFNKPKSGLAPLKATLFCLRSVV